MGCSDRRSPCSPSRGRRARDEVLGARPDGDRRRRRARVHADDATAVEVRRPDLPVRRRQARAVRRRGESVHATRRSPGPGAGTTSSKKLATHERVAGEQARPTAPSRPTRPSAPAGRARRCCTRNVVARPAPPALVDGAHAQDVRADGASRGVHGDRQTRNAPPSTEQRKPPRFPVAESRKVGVVSAVVFGPAMRATGGAPPAATARRAARASSARRVTSRRRTPGKLGSRPRPSQLIP